VQSKVWRATKFSPFNGEVVTTTFGIKMSGRNINCGTVTPFFRRGKISAGDEGVILKLMDAETC